MEALIAVVQSVGFPIAVSLFFMFRVEKVIARNTDAFIQIREVITQCNKKHA
jgi:hypothetical protein